MNFRDPNFGDMPKCHLEYVSFRSTYCYWMYFDRFKISAPFRTSHQNVWAMGVGRWKGQSIFVVYLIRSVCSMHVLFLECHVHMFLRGWNIEEDSPLVWPGLFQQLSPENYQSMILKRTIYFCKYTLCIHMLNCTCNMSVLSVPRGEWQTRKPQRRLSRRNWKQQLRLR